MNENQFRQIEMSAAETYGALEVLIRSVDQQAANLGAAAYLERLRAIRTELAAASYTFALTAGADRQKNPRAHAG